MEISGEIKAKVFAPYLGQTIRVKNYELRPETELIDYKMIGVSDTVVIFDKVRRVYRISEPSQLLLKPVEVITSEDINGLLSVISPKGFNPKKSCNQITFQFHWGDEIEQAAIDLDYPDFITGQFLQSKGYDIPSFYLSGKTLKDSGLAIYE